MTSRWATLGLMWLLVGVLSVGVLFSTSGCMWWRSLWSTPPLENGNSSGDPEPEKPLIPKPDEDPDAIESTKSLKVTLGILAGLSVLGFVITGALLYLGSKMAALFAICSTIGLFGSLAVLRYSALIARIGAYSLIAVLVGILIYVAFKYKNAFREVVKTAELSKTKDKKEMFEGDEETPPLADTVQSDTTKKLVAVERKKLGFKKEI